MMATITGFTIDATLSDFDVTSGIKLEGTYTKEGSGGLPAASSISVYALEGGVMTKINGSNIVLNPNGTFSLTVNNGNTTAAKIADGDQVQFVFVNNKSTANTGDDAIITTSPTVSIFCFYPGTLIATPDGEVVVEDLAINDMVLRQDGTAAPIRWMGRNTISMLFADKMKAVPVRIRKGALAENVPSRDLLLSPDHAVLVGDILVQAGALVNGTSILRETNVPSKFVYYHIELADHALVMAENTPSETFIDNVDRMAFDNWAEHEALYGDEAPLVEMDLPRAKSQRQVPASVRQRLADRAAELGYAAVTTAVA